MLMSYVFGVGYHSLETRHINPEEINPPERNLAKERIRLLKALSDQQISNPYFWYGGLLGKGTRFHRPKKYRSSLNIRSN